MLLKGKRIVITGGGGEIGTATAQLCLAEGAKVLIADVREDALHETAATLDNQHLYSCVADVTSAEDNAKMIEMAEEKLGGLDGFFANAGLEGEVAPITHYDPDTFDRVMAVNVRGPWLGIKAAMPALARTGGGSIVITSSIAGRKGSPGLSGYCISKHAVIGLMRCAALEGAGLGIRVNTVNPAPVYSRMIRSIEESINPDDPDAIRASITATIPMKRYAEAQEVAQTVAFLLSERSAFTTGGIHGVDGGQALS